MSSPNINNMSQYLLQLQETLVRSFQTEDSDVNIQKDRWQHDSGGGGCTIAFSQGPIIESGGVNVSHVKGTHLPASATVQRPELAGRAFEALGISFIIHPKNPYVPTMHGNIRFFIANKKNHTPIWWFGGGFDLTPYYAFTEDCILWHQHAEKLCQPFGDDVYPKYKKWCDEYFYLKHRNETRGIGGLFFDDLNQWPFETCHAFWQTIGDNFIGAYLPIIQKRKHTPYGQRERDFQCYRRGRYVEFNLVYDRGTLFGLQSNGRTESILVSMPPVVNWRYNWKPEIGSKEAELYEYFLKPQDWLHETV